MRTRASRSPNGTAITTASAKPAAKRESDWTRASVNSPERTSAARRFIVAEKVDRKAALVRLPRNSQSDRPAARLSAGTSQRSQRGSARMAPLPLLPAARLHHRHGVFEHRGVGELLVGDRRLPFADAAGLLLDLDHRFEVLLREPVMADRPELHLEIF